MKNKRFLTVFLFLFVVIGVFAEDEEKIEPCAEINKAVIKGIISDAGSGELLPGVSINIEGIEKTYYSDFDGKYNIEGIELGKYNITFSYISYQTEKQEEVDVNGSDFTEINLAMKQIK